MKEARIPKKQLTRLATIVLKNEGQKQDVNLIFVDDQKMRIANRTFRGKDKTTDVLSFNLEEDSADLLGEIYISLPEAERNAREHKMTRNEELLRLFCHGILHLCGIHHPNARARTLMAAKEDKYLKSLARRGTR